GLDGLGQVGQGGPITKPLIATAAAGALLPAPAAAGPALAQSTSITLLCSPATNGGTLVNGVCVLPAATVGQPYEGFLLTSNGAVDTFTITSGKLPPGLSMPATFGAAGTTVAGTPRKRASSPRAAHAPLPAPRPRRPAGAATTTGGRRPPLTITFPVPCCNAGTVGSAYFQNCFSGGGVGPFTLTIIAGDLPPGVKQTSPSAPQVTGNNLSGTPTKAGTFTFTVNVSDSTGDHATEPGSITIAP